MFCDSDLLMVYVSGYLHICTSAHLDVCMYSNLRLAKEGSEERADGLGRTDSWCTTQLYPLA